MQVEITSGTVVGGNRVKPGDVVDVSDHEGRALIAFGKAQPAAEKPAAKRGRKAKDSDE